MRCISASYQRCSVRSNSASASSRRRSPASVSPALASASARAASRLGKSQTKPCSRLMARPRRISASLELFGTVGPLCPALKKYRQAGPKGWEIVSRHDIGQRLAVGRDCFGVAPKKPKQRRECERKTHRRSMRCRLGVGEGAVGKRQSLVDSPEHPQCEGIKGFRCGARILAEPVGEIGMARLVVEFDGLLKMVVGAGKIAEIKAGDAGNAVCDQSLGAIRLGRGFAQEKLRHFAQRCGFAAGEMCPPKDRNRRRTVPRRLPPGSPIRGRAQRPRSFPAPDIPWPRSAHCRGSSVSAAGR